MVGDIVYISIQKYYPDFCQPNVGMSVIISPTIPFYTVNTFTLLISQWSKTKAGLRFWNQLLYETVGQREEN